MQIIDTRLPGVKLIQPRVHHDARGYFLETWHTRRYQDELGLPCMFVQHNQSYSVQGVLRGMHYQRHHGQGKLIRVVQGVVWDVTVDLRVNSSTFGQWLGVELCGISDTRTQSAHQQLWVPPGLAHGFIVLSSEAIVEYLCTALYSPDDEICLRWDDPDVSVSWPLEHPVLSPRDAQGRTLAELQSAELLPVAGLPDSSQGSGLS